MNFGIFTLTGTGVIIAILTLYKKRNRPPLAKGMRSIS